VDDLPVTRKPAQGHRIRAEAGECEGGGGVEEVEEEGLGVCVLLLDPTSRHSAYSFGTHVTHRGRTGLLEAAG
jgi:hypothetical protein